MGFDPRRWRPSSGSRPLTSNVEELLVENEALRREVRSLRLQLALMQGERRASAPPPEGADPWAARARSRRTQSRGAPPGRRVTVGSSHGLSPDLVDRWGQALARHPGWSALRIGPPGGLRGLEAELRRHWWNPSLDLAQELDRRCPGLGTELIEALRGPHSRVRWAVRVAFALYGPRAPEWLSEEPLRVVDELLRRVQHLERRDQNASGRRGTRTANHSGAAADGKEEQANRNRTATDGEDQKDSRSRHANPGQGQGPRGGRSHRHRSGPDPASGGQQEARGRDDASGRRARRDEQGGRQAGDGPHRSRASDPRLQALALLGLEPDATAAAIKRAYRRLAKTHHPDLGGDAEAFLRLDAAYRSLL